MRQQCSIPAGSVAVRLPCAQKDEFYSLFNEYFNTEPLVKTIRRPVPSVAAATA